MTAYNFQPQFAEAIRCGRKRQTIRRCRKRPTVAGEALSLYTGQRTRACALLLETVCIAVRPLIRRAPGQWAFLDGHTELPLSPLDLTQLAIADGFSSREELDEWFTHHHGSGPLPNLRLIRWDYPDRGGSHV